MFCGGKQRRRFKPSGNAVLPCKWDLAMQTSCHLFSEWFNM